MEPATQKAFDFAADTVKQLINLSTGIIALTITFSRDLLGELPRFSDKLLMSSWIVYVLSILFGVWTLMALTGTLEPVTADEVDNPMKSPSIQGGNVRIPAALQVISFVVAIVLMVGFGISAVW